MRPSRYPTRNRVILRERSLPLRAGNPVNEGRIMGKRKIVEQQGVEFQKLYDEGKSLADIGRMFNVTRERVRQILPHANKTRLYWRNWENFIAKGIGNSLSSFFRTLPPHGTHYYYSHYGCRCDLCTKGNNTYCKKWRREHHEQFTAGQSRWKRNNKDKVRQYVRTWKEKHFKKDENQV